MKLSHLILLSFALAACAPPGSHRAAVAPRRATLTADDIARAPNVPLEELLLARVPGMTMTRASDGHAVLHLHSLDTPGEDREVLYVVNGIALGDPRNVEAINLHDIALVDVVRDPAGLASYGVRGANGVVLITMKGW
jgi:TonB-dependent SusC/RagA subfamily outer membrane receptor